MAQVAIPGETTVDSSSGPSSLLGYGAPLRAYFVLHAALLSVVGIGFAALKFGPGEDRIAQSFGVASMDEFHTWYPDGDPVTWLFLGNTIGPQQARERMETMLYYDPVAPPHVQFLQYYHQHLSWTPIALILLVATIVTAYRLT